MIAKIYQLSITELQNFPQFHNVIDLKIIAPIKLINSV